MNDRTIIKTATRNIELKGSSQTFQLSVYPVRQGLIDWTVVPELPGVPSTQISSELDAQITL